MKSHYIALLLAALAGCAAVGPDYHRPQAALINAPGAAQPFMGSTSTLVTRAAVPDKWWHLYQDEILNHLVEDALNANPDIKVAVAHLAEHAAILSAVQSEQDVRVGADAAAARGRLSGESYLLPVALPVMNLGDAGIRASYQLDLVGALQRASQAADADLAQSRAALDLARISIVADVMLSYTENCAAGHELDIAEYGLTLLQHNRTAVARLVSEGRKMKLDLPHANGQVEQVRALIPVYRARQKSALYRLAVLTGRTPSDYPENVADCRKLPELHQPIPVGDGASLLRRRPDVRQAEQALVGATARIGMSVAALYPTVTLGFSAGASGILDHLGQAPTQRFSLGPLISWTFPGALEHARVRMAESAADASLAHFDSTVLKALLEVESALTVYANDQDRATELRHARDEAAEAKAETETLYRSGRMGYLEDLDSERKLAQAQATLAEADIAVARDQVRLFLALGGGWGNTEGSAE